MAFPNQSQREKRTKWTRTQCDGKCRRGLLPSANEASPQAAELYVGGSDRRFMTGSGKTSPKWTALIERYFTERLMRQRNVSANTIASYRDTFRLLFTFALVRLRKPPSALALNDLDAAFIGAFR